MAMHYIHWELRGTRKPSLPTERGSPNNHPPLECHPRIFPVLKFVHPPSSISRWNFQGRTTFSSASSSSFAVTLAIGCQTCYFTHARIELVCFPFAQGLKLRQVSFLNSTYRKENTLLVCIGVGTASGCRLLILATEQWSLKDTG